MVPTDSKLEVYKEDINQRETLVYTPKNDKRSTGTEMKVKGIKTEKKITEFKAFAVDVTTSRRSSAATRKRVVKYVRGENSVAGESAIHMTNAML